MPRVSGMVVSAGAAGLRTKTHTNPGAVSAGNWNAWETESPVQLKKKGLKQGAGDLTQLVPPPQRPAISDALD